ncbi:toprim domain-containing protein [Nonomuraea sp. NPDC003707]
MRIHVLAHRFFQDRLAASWVPRYLHQRGFPDDVLTRWGVGYAPATGTALLAYLHHTRGISLESIEQAGLAARDRSGRLIDRFRNRLMLPYRAASGSIVGFVGRAPSNASPTTPKYLNTPETSIFHKGAILFGLYEGRTVLRSGARPAIVEGPLDVLANTVAGIPAVCPGGTALTSAQLTALADAADVRRTGLVIAFDSDQAGQKALIRTYADIYAVASDPVAARFPEGSDPADVLTRRGGPALASIMVDEVVPLGDAVVDAVLRDHRTLRFNEERLMALRAAARFVVKLPPEQVTRQAGRLMQLLDLPSDMVTEAIVDEVRDAVQSAPKAVSRPHDPPHQVRRGRQLHPRFPAHPHIGWRVRRGGGQPCRLDQQDTASNVICRAESSYRGHMYCRLQ